MLLDLKCLLDFFICGNKIRKHSYSSATNLLFCFTSDQKRKLTHSIVFVWDRFQMNNIMIVK